MVKAKDNTRAAEELEVINSGMRSTTKATIA
jgi:hypothetical protein